MTTDLTSATNAASPLGSASSEGLGLAPERATCECCAFMHEATREAQALGSHYAQQVMDQRAEIQRLRAALQMAVRQNEHDMLMTGDELRACRAALEA